jgi:hypothetical protein
VGVELELRYEREDREGGIEESVDPIGHYIEQKHTDIGQRTGLRKLVRS